MVSNGVVPSGLSRRTLLQLMGAVGAGTAAAGVLSACSPGTTSTTKALASVSPSTASGSATLWFRDDDLLKVFKTLLPGFSKKYPNVKLTLVGVDVDTKLPPALVSGTGVPDGSFFTDNNILGQAEHLYDVSQLMSKYTADTVQYKLDVNSYQGKLVGIPWDTDPGLLYYREDVLSGAKVDPGSLTSYDALLNAAREIKGRNPNARPIPLEQDPNLAMQWLMMLVNQQQGTGMIDANGKLTIDTDAFRKALTWIKAVADEGLGARSKFASSAQIAQADGDVISLAPWAIWFNFLIQSTFKKSVGHWRVAELPAWTPGGARSGVMGGSSFVIPAKAAHPELAWLFYEYAVYSAEGYKGVFGPNSVYPNGINTALPSVKSALDPANPLFKPLAGLGSQSVWDVGTKASLAIPAGYRIPSWFNQAATYLGANLQKLMDGRMSVDDVVKKSASAIQTNLVDRSH
ncbi:extracellular solute-binding protein [Jatrophihabitans telluris]|uniref:Extracellular solute-binding protein n=1 Tax=Jatrophihabitans telluris TaxID=2038343 RepID=A0ABY4QY39_9ACTN|nr:extracellular solute-binding protein [Jatrophihabitans telluris]UQX88418.1 extracellular solute-binding protein [Jatrophihabitans telluris]